MTAKMNIKTFYDNPLKRRGLEIEHDTADAEHFDEVAEKFLEEQGERALLVDLHEDKPPRHRAFWHELLDAPGKRILDVGCGYGYAACLLAMMGADVTAIDVSKGMCELTRKAAQINGVDVDVRNISAISTGFPEEHFDIITGQVSLHHLPLESAAPELARVLKTGGRAVFIEPIQPHQWLFKLRAKLPLACYESPGGGALRLDEIRAVGDVFGDFEIEFFNITERLRRFKPLDCVSPILYTTDSILLKIPGMSGFAASAVITFYKT